MKKISIKYKEIAQFYKYLGFHAQPQLDWSDDACLQMYEWESKGKQYFIAKHGTSISKNNGYAYGKFAHDLLISEWKKDIKDGLLYPSELYARFPVIAAKIGIPKCADKVIELQIQIEKTYDKDVLNLLQTQCEKYPSSVVWKNNLQSHIAEMNYTYGGSH